MLFSKALAALTFAAFAMASPVKRDDAVTCYFIMTPTPELAADALQTSINYAVGRTVAVNWSGFEHEVQAVNEPLVRHDDGTYDVQSAISVTGVSKEDVAAFVDTWDNTTLQGFNNNWYVNAATCVVPA